MAAENQAIDYQKRQTVPQTGHGNYFQILASMYYAFVLTLETRQSFKLHTEDTNFGDFDDIVIYTDAANVTAMQLKHRQEKQGQYAFSDFICESGNNNELMLYKYFDSLENRIPNMQYQNETFEFVSNFSLPSEMIGCINKESGKFIDLCNEQALTPQQIYVRNSIVASVEKYSSRLKNNVMQPKVESLCNFLNIYFQLESVHGTLRKKIFGFIKDKFPMTQKRFNEGEKKTIIQDHLKRLGDGSLKLRGDHLNDFIKILNSDKPVGKISLYEIAQASYSPYLTIINNFLQKLRFKFGSPHVEQLKDSIQRKLQTHFNTTSNIIFLAFFDEFYQWLISPKGKELDNQQIKNLFSGWYDNYIHLERLNGLTQQHLRNTGGMLADGKKFTRQDALDSLKKFAIEEPSVFILHGESGSGKSSLVKAWYESLNSREGICIFLDIHDYLNAFQQEKSPLNLANLKSLKYICVDNAELLLNNESLQAMINKLIPDAIRTNKKVIMLSKVRARDLSQYIPQLKIQSSYREQLLNPLPLTEVLERYDFLHAYTKLPSVMRLLGIPFYLNLLIKQKIDYLLLEHLGNGAKEDRLQYYLIQLAIESSTEQQYSPRNQRVLSKARKSLLRKLIYAKNKTPSKFVTLNLSDREVAIAQGLIADGILVKPEDNCYNFGHSLYEEWATRYITKKLLKEALEQDENPMEFFLKLNKLLPKNKRIFGEVLLHDNPEFNKQLSITYPTHYDTSLNNLTILALSVLNTTEVNVSVCYPLTIAEFQPQVNSWKAKCTYQDVLFIFSPAEQSWLAFLITDTKKNTERCLIDKDSSFGHVLAEINANTFCDCKEKLAALLKTDVLFLTRIPKIQANYVKAILEVMYQVSYSFPLECAQFFTKIDLKKHILIFRHSTLIHKILMKLATLESSFSIAVNSLSQLVDYQYDWEERHDNDHVQYSLDTIFYPLVGNISYQVRETYLNECFATPSFDFAPLLPALYSVIQICTMQTTPEIFGSAVDEELENSPIYTIPMDNEGHDDPSFWQYCENIMQLIIKISKSNSSCAEDAKSILRNFVEENFNSLLMEDFTRKAILEILRETDLADSFAIIIESAYDIVQSGDLSKFHDKNDFPIFSARVKEFYQAYIEAITRPSNVENNIALAGYNRHGLLQASSAATASKIEEDEPTLTHTPN